MTKGLRVRSVTRGSQASGKLESGDIIISCNGISVASLSDLTNGLEAIPDGEDVSIVVERRGQRRFFSFLKARLGVEFDEVVGRQESPTGSPTIEPLAGETSTMRSAASGEAFQDGVSHAAGDVIKNRTGPVNLDGKYDLARAIAKIVIVVGWLSVGAGALLFFIGLGADGMERTFLAMVGLLGVWQSLLLVLVAYGLVGVFDAADNSERICFSVQKIEKELSVERKSN